MENNSLICLLFILFFCCIMIEKHSFSEIIVCQYLCQNNILALWLRFSCICLLCNLGNGLWFLVTYVFVFTCASCVFIQKPYIIRILETVIKSTLGVLVNGCEQLKKKEREKVLNMQLLHNRIQGIICFQKKN